MLTLADVLDARRKRLVVDVLAAALLLAAASASRAETIDTLVRRPDGEPLAGVEVRLYRQSDSLLISSAATNAAGNATVVDTTYVGTARCLSVTGPGSLTFTGCNIDNQTIPCLAAVHCVNNFGASYFFWGSHPTGASLMVVGGPRGYVNPDAGERADISIAKIPAGPGHLKIFTMSGRLVYERDYALLDTVENHFYWSGVTTGGQAVGSGIYVVRLEGPFLKTAPAKIAIVRR